MARPAVGPVTRAFQDAYKVADLKQVEVEAGLHERGFTNVDQPLVSKWLRGVRPIPLDVLPALDEIVGQRRGYLLRAAGYVDDSDLDVRAAIMADPDIDDMTKSFLIHIYSDGVERATKRTRSASPAKDEATSSSAALR